MNVPEDVMKAARRAHGYADDQEGTWAKANIDRTAHAIMAERERCDRYLEGAVEDDREAHNLAKAIRKGDA